MIRDKITKQSKDITTRIFCFVANVLFKKTIEHITRSISKNITQISEIDEIFVNALIAAEDHRYYNHIGVDFIGVLRAVKSILINNKLQGASTIEQQLVRTLSGDYRLNLTRKIKEAITAIALNMYLSKQTIAKSYIYYAYYGWMMNGFDEAKERLNFNDKNTCAKTAAFLVSLLKYPMPKIPTEIRMKAIMNRKAYVLKRLILQEINNETTIRMVKKSNRSLSHSGV